MIKFIYSGLKTFYYQFKKKQADILIQKMKKMNSKTLVLGIHGSAMNYYNSFFPMLKYFSEKKVKFIPLDYDYSDNIDLACKKLLNQITNLKKYKKVYVVSHSYGGLLSRYFASKFLGDNSKFHIIQIAPANNPLSLPDYGPINRIIYKIVISAQPFLQHHYANNLKNVKFTIIRGSLDTLVTKKIAKLNSVKPEIILLNEDHLSILYSKKLFEIIFKIVKK